MNNLEVPPPPYEQASDFQQYTTENANKHKWYTKLIELKFTHDEANKYAGYFATNEIDLTMIPELTESVLRTIGIEKTGHCIRILRLQQKPPAPTANPTPNVTVPSVITPTCYRHRNVAANEKCRHCKRLVCLSCRRQKSSDYGPRYYCQECYEECIIL